MRLTVGVLALLLAVCVGVPAWAQDSSVPAVDQTPGPLHNFDGSGGLLITPKANLVNPGAAGDIFGLPSVSLTGWAGEHKDGSVFAVSETILGRLELSYAFQWLNLEDFARSARENLGVHVEHDSVYQHVLGARLLLLDENELIPWSPAITFGVDYKRNIRFDQLNRSMDGALNHAGIRDEDGVEYTLVATKTFKGVLPLPFFISAGVRNTDAVQTGWMGFTNDRVNVFEGNIGFWVTDKLLLAGEFKQKSSDVQSIHHVLGQENNWWSLLASYQITKNLSATAGYMHMGTMMNQEDPKAMILQVKADF